MMIPTTPRVWLSALCAFGSALVVTRAERYYVNNLFGDNGNAPFVQDEEGRRFLQLDTGRPADINQTLDTCDLSTDALRCQVQTTVTANDGTSTFLDMAVECDFDPQNQAEFREAKNCGCGVQITRSDGTSKTCTCEVCPAGFGDAPIAVDCEDELVIGSCASLDCFFGCNGSCSFSCDFSGPDCPFCDGEFAPTSAPTGPSPTSHGAALVLSSLFAWQVVAGLLMAVSLYGW